MSYVGHRSESEILVQKFLDDWVLLAQSDVHLDCALAVPDVVQGLICYLVHILENRREIIIGHVLE